MNIHQKITRRGLLQRIFPKKQNRKNLFQFSIGKFPFLLQKSHIGNGNKVKKYIYDNTDFDSEKDIIKIDAIYKYLEANNCFYFKP